MNVSGICTISYFVVYSVGYHGNMMTWYSKNLRTENVSAGSEATDLHMPMNGCEISCLLNTLDAHYSPRERSCFQRNDNDNPDPAVRV